MSKLIHASKSNPCPICTKTGWCYELSDTLWCCKRSDSAPPDWVRTTKQDSDGAWYFAIENDLNSDDRAAKKEEWERLKAEREANQREVQQQEFKTQLTAVQRDPLIRALSQKLGLSSQHCQMLRERGLTDEQIKAGLFFSIPSWQEVSNRYPLNLPGIKQTNDGKRFVATTKDESTGKYVGGIAIVAIDASGWATGWQLMSVPRIEDKKYTWALGEKSSHLPIGNGELPIQVVGTATNPDTAWGCEGLLKSFVASGRINDRFIGASSGLFRSSPSGTKTALEGVKTIKLTVDAGDAINPQRVRHWRLETEFFQSLGLTVLFPWWGQTTKEQNDIDELTADEFKAIAYLTPDRFFEMAELEESKLEDGKAFIKNNQEDDHTHLLQRELGHLLEVKGKKAPAIFQGDLYKSLSSAANNFNIPVEILVFCLLPILSSRIPSETRLLINPGTNYLVPALRWNALVGETGTKKSPVLKALLAPLLNIQKQIAAKYKEQKDIYDKEYGIWKAEKVKGRGEEPTLPAPMLDCYFSDFTIESIGQSISDHSDNSYLVFVDELAGFFKSMDAYRKAGGDRQKWLDLYNAGALKINRKGSPTIFCPHTSVSLLGGLQPSILEQMIKTDESSEDGLWNRFMFCRLPQAKTAAFSHNSISLFDCLSSLYLNLAAAKPIEHKLSDAAKPLWEAWHDAIEERIMTETSELVRGTYAKVEGVAGRNALIIHRVTAAQQGAIPDTCISGEVMQMAIEWTQWELGQTLLEYQRLGLTEDPELSRILRLSISLRAKDGLMRSLSVLGGVVRSSRPFKRSDRL